MTRPTPCVVWGWPTANVAPRGMGQTDSTVSHLIMKTTHTVTHTFDKAALSLHGEGLSIVDSVTKDNVTVHGLSRVQVAREISWWLDIHACSHNEGERVDVRKQLIKMQESLTKAISKLSPETEEAAK